MIIPRFRPWTVLNPLTSELTRAWWLSATGYVAAQTSTYIPYIDVCGRGHQSAAGRGDHLLAWAGALSRYRARGGLHKVTAGHPGDSQCWPTFSHLLHHMVLLWSLQTKGLITKSNQRYFPFRKVTPTTS